MSQQQTGMEGGGGSARKGGVTARLMGATVFIRQENRKVASDKHNILLLIFPAWLPWNPTLPSNSPIWKLLPPTGSIKMRQITFSHYVSRRTDGRAKYVQIKQITRPMNENLITQKNFGVRREPVRKRGANGRRR